MENIKKTLENWLNELNSFTYIDYEKLPDLDLYMDQVVTFLEKQVQIFKTSSLDKQITPSMINNYVKGEVVPAPISKRYNKEHLASLEEVLSLKQVLTIAEVKQIISEINSKDDLKADLFNEFNKANTEKISIAVNDAFKALNTIGDNDVNSLTKLAFDFALYANAYISISKRILFLTRVFDTLNNKEEN